MPEHRHRDDFWAGLDALEGWLQAHAAFIPWLYFAVGFLLGRFL